MSRLAILSMLSVFAVTPLSAETPAAPAPAPPALACDGQMAILYHNQIKQGGSIDGIIEAAKVQEAWYRAHGIADNRILVMKVVKRDAKTKQSAYATDEIFTLHVNPPASEKIAAAADAGKQDYAAKYKANATVLEKRTICLPKL
jgi:xanthosine utilization system XapX-like protein